MEKGWRGGCGARVWKQYNNGFLTDKGRRGRDVFLLLGQIQGFFLFCAKPRNCTRDELLPTISSWTTEGGGGKKGRGREGLGRKGSSGLFVIHGLPSSSTSMKSRCFRVSDQQSFMDSLCSSTCASRCARMFPILRLRCLSDGNPSPYAFPFTYPYLTPDSISQIEFDDSPGRPPWLSFTRITQATKPTNTTQTATPNPVRHSDLNILGPPEICLNGTCQPQCSAPPHVRHS
jgi:hypothetical protein